MVKYGVVWVNKLVVLIDSNELMWFEGHCFLMMEDLQQAYAAYQQALYHLRDPKVGRCLHSCAQANSLMVGTKTMVRNRNTLRSLWIT